MAYFAYHQASNWDTSVTTWNGTNSLEFCGEVSQRRPWPTELTVHKPRSPRCCGGFLIPVHTKLLPVHQRTLTTQFGSFVDTSTGLVASPYFYWLPAKFGQILFTADSGCHEWLPPPPLSEGRLYGWREWVTKVPLCFGTGVDKG